MKIGDLVRIKKNSAYSGTAYDRGTVAIIIARDGDRCDPFEGLKRAIDGPKNVHSNLKRRKPVWVINFIGDPRPHRFLEEDLEVISEC
jgi:hypothetical protein